MKNIFCLFIILICKFSFAIDLYQKPKIHKLNVGVLMIMPFAQNLNGHYSGIAIDLWERIAKYYNWEYTYIPLGQNIKDGINTLANGTSLDIIIGPVSVTSARLKEVDYTRPFYLSSIGVITKKHEISLWDIFKVIFSKNLFHVIIIFVSVFIFYLSMLWIFEKNKTTLEENPEYFTKLTQRIWLHLFQKKVDYMPRTTHGRVIGIFWILFAAATFTAINANITSALTIARYENANITNSLEGLQASKLAGIKGQISVDIAQKDGIEVVTTPNLDEAIQLLENDKVDGVVCDKPVGVYYLRTKRLAKLMMGPSILENDELAFAVKLNSPIRHEIDLALTGLQDDDSVVPICHKYIGDEAKQCDL